MKFLLRFDVRYRQRRVRFVVRAVNELYTRTAEPAFAGLVPEDLDRIKAGLYDLPARPAPAHDRLSQRCRPHAGGRSPRSGRPSQFAVRIGCESRDARCDRGGKPIRLWPLRRRRRTHFSDQDLKALDLVGDDMALVPHNVRADALLISLVGGDVPALVPAARRELLEHYIGFAVWDVLTFSITNWRDLDEFDEIRVDRLSPDDAQTLRKGGATATLKGTQFHHFGAFFSLAYRQNDYLWGRLHAAERLIDIVLDAAAIEGAAEGIDALALKKQAFRAILDTEARHLSHCLDLIVRRCAGK